jgi:site-specific DNA-methyltransferase (adenine-specific)
LQSGAVTTHPTEKPVRLIRELVESSSCFDEIVLDPFAGSGSTLLAAVLEGRKAVGIEISESFCADAAKRLSAMAIEAGGKIHSK